MRRLFAVALLVMVGIAGLLGADGPDPKSGATPAQGRDPARPKTELVPDPRWEPTPGQRVTVRMEFAPAAIDGRTFEDFANSTLTGDRDGIEEAYRDGSVLKIARGSKVLILRDHAPVRATEGSRSAAAFDDARVNVRPAIPSEKYPIEVRILDGRDAGRLAYMDRRDIAKLVERRVLPAMKPGDRATVAKPWSVITKDRDELHGYKFANMDGDRNAVTAMIRNGQLSRIDDGAKVLIVAIDGEFARVRVLNGSRFAGNAGFMPLGDLIPPSR